MLSYQHAYHAGNFADVVKHLVLVQVLHYLKKKNKPLCCLDTHAGSGSYRLASGEAQKNLEYLGGIGKLWHREDLPVGIADYVSLIRHFNPSGQLSQYPGSPLIVRQLLENQDRQFLFELHSAEYRQLNELFKKQKQCKVFHADGLKESLGLLPPLEHRGAVLIDPSYELKSDYQTVADSLKAMHMRFATGCYMLWYPVVDRKRNRFMERALKSTGIKNIQLYELGVQPDHDGFGMTACGMIVVNPPWTLLSIMQEALPWLSEILGENQQGYYRIEQLVSE